MKKWQISRRTMLRGAGAALALPMLDVMETAASIPVGGAFSGNTNAVRRMAYLYFPNGVADNAWGVEETGSDGSILALNRWMSPFDELKSDIIIPRNMWTPRGNGHGSGTATWLTGFGYDDRRIDAGGASADQIAAHHCRDKTLLPSLELSTQGQGFFSGSLNRNSISWSNSRTPMPRDTEPRVVFDRMFRSGTGGASDRSVLDAVLEDARSMQRSVSAEDRRKIDEYLESVRSIERRLEFADQNAQRIEGNSDLQQSLNRPPAGIPVDHGEYLRTMFDIMTLAFWSDATRVCTFMLDHGQSNRYFNFIDGVQGTWHALSHWRDASGRTEDDDGVTSWSSVREKLRMYNEVTRWHNEQVAYFLKRLKSIREPNGGTLLDNSMILYGSSLADGHEHAERNLPMMLAGRGGGTINSGREITFRRSKSMSDLHLSMLQRMGVEADRFGESRSAMAELD
ncbi:MAG: DUF1552 domain-containing protein [Planctomycetota bacterium]